MSAAAELLGRSNQTIYRWITSGTIPAYRVGEQWHIITADLKATMEAGASSSAESIDEGQED
ncbi:helix-turn-helix domain-containing protein [Nesterenkonia halophila]